MSLRNPKTVVLCKDLKIESDRTTKVSSIFEKIISKLADKYDLSTNEVRCIVLSVFKFTNVVLTNSVKKPYVKEDLVRVRWIGFGSFQISKWRVNNYFKRRLKNEGY